MCSSDLAECLDLHQGIPWWLSNVGDPGSIPESGRSPGAGNGNPLQYSCLENPMNAGAWLAIVHRAAKSQTRLSDFTITRGKSEGGKKSHTKLVFWKNNFAQGMEDAMEEIVLQEEYQ